MILKMTGFKKANDLFKFQLIMADVYYFLWSILWDS